MKEITKFLHKDKSNIQINSRGLIISMMKNNLTLDQTCEIYGIPKRTIFRSIAEIKRGDKELHSIYKLYKQNIVDMPNREKIIDLDSEPVLLDKTTEELKREEIIDIVGKYEELLKQNPSLTPKRVAAKLGFTAQQMDEMSKKISRIDKGKQFKEKYHYGEIGISEKAAFVASPEEDRERLEK